MTRYDLIVKRVDGCASAKVEKHELGSFVKYVDVMKHIAELEADVKRLKTKVFASFNKPQNKCYIRAGE